MWTELPSDVLSKIFSFLTPDSLACASSTCCYWHKCTKKATTHLALGFYSNTNNWFMALPTRTNLNSLSCYALNPITNHWHSISINFLPPKFKPLASTQSLVLFGASTSTTTKNLELIACNPFTREFKKLPPMNSPRSNPAIGVVKSLSNTDNFQIYVAGGTHRANYDLPMEVYETSGGAWRVIGTVPAKIAVRLTVWSPEDGVWVKGEMYWITSARAFSVVVFSPPLASWRTIRAPMAEKLEFAAVIERRGRAAVVGGVWGGEAHVWELVEGDEWILAAEVPPEMAAKFVGKGGEKESWVGTKCTNCNGALCLYGNLRSGIIVWKEVGFDGKWEWFWVDGCGFVGGNIVPNLNIKGLFLQPTLHSLIHF